MKNIDEDIAKLQEKYIAAVSSRNVGALIQLYDPKVRIFDAWGLWEYQGIESWRIAVEGWLSSNPNGKFFVRFSEGNVVGNHELATLSAIVHYAIVGQDGSELHSMHNRITWVVRTSSHNLRIIHEHTSAPIGFEDMKAILKKQN